MKLLKYLILSIVLSGVTACNIEKFEEEVITNIPDDNTVDAGLAVFSANIGNTTFIADNPVATVIDNAINITGIKTSTGELITLTIVGNTVGTYVLGVTENQVEVNSASYVTNLDGSGNTWIAATDFVTPQGEIEIVEIDLENETISGTFAFTGHSANGLEPLEFTRGLFTNISFASGLVTSDDTNTFSAMVDGNNFVQESINAAQTTLSTTSTINIVATKTSLETISLTFDASIVPGDYTFEGLSVPIAQYNLSLTESNLGEGTFTITSHDTENRRIAGTFSFTASPVLDTGASFEITEGRFDVSYL